MTNFDGIAHQAVDRHARRPRCDQQVLHRTFTDPPQNIGMSANAQESRRKAWALRASFADGPLAGERIAPVLYQTPLP